MCVFHLVAWGGDFQSGSENEKGSQRTWLNFCSNREAPAARNHSKTIATDSKTIKNSIDLIARSNILIKQLTVQESAAKVSFPWCQTSSPCISEFLKGCMGSLKHPKLPTMAQQIKMHTLLQCVWCEGPADVHQSSSCCMPFSSTWASDNTAMRVAQTISY